MGAAVIVNDATFKEQVLKSELPVMVDFFADWCGPCVRMAPVVEEAANDYQGKVKICKLNVSESNTTATEYSIMSIPTFMFFKNGQVVDQTVGAMSKDQLRARLDALLAGEKK